MSARASQIGALVDAYRDRVVEAAMDDAGAEATNAQINARIAVDAALASVCEDAERWHAAGRHALNIQQTARAAEANWRSHPNQDYWMDRMDEIIDRLGKEGRALRDAVFNPLAARLASPAPSTEHATDE